MTNLDHFLDRAEKLLDKVERLLPQVSEQTNWDQPSIAYRWRRRNGNGFLQPIQHTTKTELEDLYFVERQKEILEQNTRQFIEGKPANNVLLTGARGTGKSSLIRACLNQFADKGLRLIEVDKNDLLDLIDIAEIVSKRKEKFILFCDDLSFDDGDSNYRELKSALDGSVAVQPDNMLIYATSNRRHLLPEKFSDNQGYALDEKGDIHPSETIEEKISVSDRFGVWLSFYSFSQEEYLTIVKHWLSFYGLPELLIEKAHEEALQWALLRGSRSGRTALQFAKDYAGKHL